MKIDEYTPTTMPMNRASANSSSASAPSRPQPIARSDNTGRMEAMLVLSERINTWFIEMFTMSGYGVRTEENLAWFSFTRSNTTIVS